MNNCHSASLSLADSAGGAAGAGVAGHSLGDKAAAAE